MNTPNVWAGIKAPHGDYPRPGTWVGYLLLDDDGMVVYVGMSRTFASRLRHHRATRTFASWVALSATDEKDAAELEADLIREYQPAGNVAGVR